MINIYGWSVNHVLNLFGFVSLGAVLLIIFHREEGGGKTNFTAPRVHYIINWTFQLI